MPTFNLTKILEMSLEAVVTIDQSFQYHGERESARLALNAQVSV